MPNMQLFGIATDQLFRSYNYTTTVKEQGVDGVERTRSWRRGDEITLFSADDQLTEEEFIRSLNFLKQQNPTPDGGWPQELTRHLFETLDLNDDSTLTMDELNRALQILIDLASKSSQEVDFTVSEWERMRSAGGALEHVYSRQFCGVTLLDLFKRTADGSSSKAFFEISKTEFADLLDRLGVFEGWTMTGLLQNKKYAIDFLWSLFRQGNGVIGARTDMAESSNAHLSTMSVMPGYTRYEKLLEQQGPEFADSNLSIHELESLCRAFLGKCLDDFMMQFYRDQEKIYRNLSQSIKEMNR